MENESYLPENKPGQMAGTQMPKAPPNYMVNVHQPAGENIKPRTIPYNNAHVQQPSRLTVVNIPSRTIARYQVDDHMCLSIFSCLFCCWPIGFVAVVMSCMVCVNRRSGDSAGADSFSKWAKILSIAAIICGIITIVVVIIIGAASGSNGNN